MIAGVLEGSLDLRAAGSGRLTRTANRPDDLEGVRRRATSRRRLRRDRPPRTTRMIRRLSLAWPTNTAR